MTDISALRSLLYFGSYRAGGFGPAAIWEATWTVVLESLQCSSSDCGDVQLHWSNPSGLEHTAVSVRRDNRKIADLEPGATSFTDADPPVGLHIYVVAVTFDGSMYSQRCQVEVVCSGPRFLRGECNGDDKVDISAPSARSSGFSLAGMTPAAAPRWTRTATPSRTCPTPSGCWASSFSAGRRRSRRSQRAACPSSSPT